MKIYKSKFEFGTMMLLFAFCLAIAVMTCSCKTNEHYYSSKKTASGRHDYYTPGWGYNSTCKTYNKLPIKKKSYNNLKYRH